MTDTLLKCTTRHIRLFTARVVNEDLIPDLKNLTMDLDPDNEFLWSNDAIEKLNKRFEVLVEESSGSELSDYTLRRMGTELEGYIRQLLQSGFIMYNTEGRVQNFSMGLPRTPELL